MKETPSRNLVEHYTRPELTRIQFANIPKGRYFFWKRSDFICLALGESNYEINGGAFRECSGEDVYAECLMVNEGVDLFMYVPVFQSLTKD